MIAAAAFEIAAAASAGTMPARAWARANAASASVQRARKASSPNTPRIAAVPNMSPNKVDERTPIVIQQPKRFNNKNALPQRALRVRRGRGEEIQIPLRTPSGLRRLILLR